MRRNQLPGAVLLLLSLLLLRDAVDTAEPHYVVLVPSQLYSGVTEKACVMLKDLNETVTVTMTIEFGGQSWNLLSKPVAEKASFFCHPFSLPELSTHMAYITVQVKGPTQQFRKKQIMGIKKIESLVFVHTDKPVYKPAQTVRFRIVSVNINFYPLDEMFPVVYIENPKKNRIFQWQNIRLQGGLTQLSFPLSEEPILGPYKVIVQKNLEKKIEHPFEVIEYVLPRFEVQVKLPNTIRFLDEEFEVSVCGQYTYGKPVPGLVTINVCRRDSQYYSPCPGTHSRVICDEFSQQADSKGCFTKLIKTKNFHLGLKGLEMALQVEGTIKEEGTDLELTGHGKCEITNLFSRLEFIKVDSYYKPGLPFFGEVLLVDEKGQAIPNKTLTAHVNDAYQFKQFKYTTNEHGSVRISIDTTNFKSSYLTVVVTYKPARSCHDMMWLQELHSQVHHNAKRLFSPSSSYIHLEPFGGVLTCGQMHKVNMHYILNEEMPEKQTELIFYSLIKAKGIIVQAATASVPVGQGNMKGMLPLSFKVESDIAPTAQMIVYTVLPKGEVVADIQEFKIENCFANKVNLSFSSAQSMPASNTYLKVKGSPLSLCGLHAVDQSLMLMRGGVAFSPQSVYRLLPSKNDLPRTYGELSQEDSEECIPRGPIGIYDMNAASRVLEDDDIYSIFQVSGVHIFTNSNIRKPRLCGFSLHQGYGPGGMLFNGGLGAFPSGIGAIPGGMGAIPGVGVGAIPGVGVGAIPGVGMGAIAGMGPVGAAGVGYAGGMSYPPPAVPPAMPIEDVQTAHIREMVRKYFPESWIWDLVVLDVSGRSEMAVKVPDTITEWKASAFCLSGTEGLGFSPTISLQVFQPFFLEFVLPYSVVQGEAFKLKATIVNYLSHCIRVRVQLEESSAFLAIPGEKNAESHCICGHERKTVFWAVTPKSLGKVNFTASAEALQSRELCGNEEPKMPSFGQKDTVVKPLLIEPEGIEKEETFNTLLCASATGVPEKLSLKIPSNVVEGSTRATYTVLGDILGSAMENLQNLVQLPYGCGEQNMILFTPNIYVLAYLSETGQLTEKIKSKAINYLTSGYQRQLNYKHNDGSYSTFGDHGGRTPGNTWLTAFVVKSFSQAQSYIFVESSHIIIAFTWLSQRQKENGCFQCSGSLLNNAMKGGVDDEVTLSAYVTIALLEMPLPVSHPVVRNALNCLEMAWKSTSEAQGNFVYTKALLAYAFALAGHQASRNEVLKSLDREAIKEEDSIHWQRPRKLQEDSTLFYQPRAPSVEVEMAAYILLAYLTAQPAPSSADLSMASRIVKWIIKQQNPHGGFSSTQDTVVALQALAKYGARIFATSQKAAIVSVKSSGAFSKEFQVNEANRLLLQEVQLPEIPGEYSTTISGRGCVYLQTTLRYNILPKKEQKAPFSLSVNTLPKDCDGAAAHKKFQIDLNISYTGERPRSNMVIVDVKMVSGFIPVKKSVKKLQERPEIPRTEVSTNHVLIYFKELTNQTLSFSFSVEQDIKIKNLKPAAVKIYDYYETDEFAIEEYSAPCSSESEQGNA
ncbi:pregnancy zone protein-like [Echinops telfairi]|uniref:Pregnancy zone protein-like n=1 Tax=Echinops telfairi TaxID=9371 RepID=A0AC55D3X5_ECHTE|nr:pregnancy zone protein-like [Echinops telfairi]